jgi:putative ABC transport system permease protein
MGVTTALALGTANVIVILTMGREVKGNLSRDLVLLDHANTIAVFYDQDEARIPQWFRPRTRKPIEPRPGGG